MNLAVLGERVFVRPAMRPEFTESGLALVHDRVASTIKGVVVALGDGPKVRKQAVQKVVGRLVARMKEAEAAQFSESIKAVVSVLRIEAERMADTYNADHTVALGDHVIFSADAGEELVFANEVIIAMRESDILAVIDEDEEAAPPPADETNADRILRQLRESGY